MAKSTPKHEHKHEEATPKAQATVLTSSLERKDDGTLLIKVTVPWKTVDDARTAVENELIKHVEVAGFRKGAAPKNIAVQKLSQDKVREELLKRVLTETYMEAVKKEGINPIMSPQIHVDEFDAGTPLVYTAETCEAPQIKLNDYKKAVQNITAKTKIVVPGKEQQKPSMDELVKAIMDQSEVKIPRIIVQQEATRLLSQTLDELKSLGITLDQYLASRNKDADGLKKEYEEKAQNDLKLEFVLRKIADEEKITVEPKDIEEALKAITDQKQRETVAQNPYLVAAIIRQQKTLDFISKL